VTSKDVNAFLEEHGLWEEARQLQRFERKEAEAAKHDGSAEIDEVLKIAQAAFSEVSVAAAPRPGQRRKDWRPALRERLEELAKIEVASSAMREAAPILTAAIDGAAIDTGACKSVAGELQALINELKAQRVRATSDSSSANPFAQALNLLRSCDAQALAARPETADEVALRILQSKSREFAPALATLRSVAVDKEIFGYLAEKLDEMEDESDDGEPSEHEGFEGGLDEVEEAGSEAEEAVAAPPPKRALQPKAKPVFGLWTQDAAPEEEADAHVEDSAAPGPAKKRLRRKTPQAQVGQ